MPVQRGLPNDMPPIGPNEHSLFVWCPTCGISDGASFWHLALDLPATQRFWRQHPRIQALPVRVIEIAGGPALLTGFECIDGQSRLEVVAARDTFEVVALSSR